MFVPVEQLAGKSIGQYKLTKLIGRSELSAVYAAASAEQGSAVMLTVFRLPDECVGEAWELFMERFEDEASGLRLLQHPHVVPYYAFGEEFGYPYLITPLTSNQTLADLLEQGACTPLQMLQLLTQIASGLDYIHSGGIVHGSLKPSNILLRAEQGQSRVLIANVGLAQILEMRGIGQVSHPLPYLFSVAGTLLTNPAYLAPEVVRGAPSDARSDMYALGILIYEMLCGRPPFTGSDPMAVALQHVNQQIPPLQSFKPELPPALDGVLRSVLDRDPARRIQSAENLVGSLERIINALQEPARRAPAPMWQGSKSMNAAEMQWQGMPGVTVNKMPSLVPEFMVAAAGMARSSTHAQFKLPATGAFPPVPRALPSTPSAAPAAPLNPAAVQHSGQILKLPMLPGPELSPAAPAFRPAQVSPMQPPLGSAAASSPAGQMWPTTQSAAIQNATPFATPQAANTYNAYNPQGASQQYSPVAANAYSPQGAGQQYSPLQAAPAQMPAAGYGSWAQAGAVEQAGQPYNDPGAARYPQGYGQAAWVQHEQPLPQASAKGRRRAALIIGGSIVAAVLGAGGIDLLRIAQNLNTAAPAAQPVNNSQSSPTSAVQPGSVPVHKKVVIANQKSLALNSAQNFINPTNRHASILVHLPNGKFVAYDRACTHQAGAVAYDPHTKTLVCPLHHAIFDPADNGSVLQGPAFLRLATVQVQVNGDGSITVEQ